MKNTVKEEKNAGWHNRVPRQNSVTSLITSWLVPSSQIPPHPIPPHLYALPTFPTLAVENLPVADKLVTVIRYAAAFLQAIIQHSSHLSTPTKFTNIHVGIYQLGVLILSLW